ncbi:MAG TPA: hypothetical protein VLT87_05365 [Thermoanaerobaculia bacterium]|nr:hypothetical protein [Thermoanaerobaculia bacterium]
MRRNRRITALALLFLGTTLAFAPGAGAQEAAAAPRDGGSSVCVAAAEPPALQGAFRFPEGHSEPAILSPEEAPSDIQAPAPARSESAPPSSRRPAGRNVRTAPLRSTDILLLIQRQNE